MNDDEGYDSGPDISRDAEITDLRARVAELEALNDSLMPVILAAGELRAWVEHPYWSGGTLPSTPRWKKLAAALDAVRRPPDTNPTCG